jgi:hypothetical protein
MKIFGVVSVCTILAGMHACAVERVANPGFETVDDKGGPAEWGWWTREPGVHDDDIPRESPKISVSVDSAGRILYSALTFLAG